MAEPRNVPVEVSARVLRHLSRGIYRSPAGALKELVSNAYDAGATEVTINTGWPGLKKIVVTDNGTGMTADTFEGFVRNIGLSGKTAGDIVRIPGARATRTTIGHYGIGILAVGQLSARMVAVSKPSGTTKGFRAELDFDQFDVVQEDGVRRSTVKDERKLEKEDEETGRGTFRIGKCRISDTRYPAKEKNNHFTKITLDAVRDEVGRKLAGRYNDNPEAKKKQAYSSKYAALLALLRENEPLARQGAYPYEKLVWEMGVYCPVPYPAVGAFAEKGKLAKLAVLASGFRFALNIDGLVVRKPFEDVFFDDKESPVEHVFTWRDEPYCGRKSGPKVSGYIIYKRRIRPKVLQGILIREGGVAIGTYDTTFLEYPYNEGQKFNQLTGEIFAEGLSGALNIDRDSFNETDDRYLALCKWLHGKLREKVFPRIKKMQAAKGSPQRKENLADLRSTLIAFARRGGGGAKVTFRKLGKSEPLLAFDGERLVINTGHRDGSGSSAKLEKVRLAAALVLEGLVEPEDIERIESVLRDARRRARGKR